MTDTPHKITPSFSYDEAETLYSLARAELKTTVEEFGYTPYKDIEPTLDRSRILLEILDKLALHLEEYTEKGVEQ